jgi:hypothetical protein
LADIQSLTFSEETFDLVIAVGVLPWIPAQASPHFCAWEVCLLDPGALNISATEATM